MNRRRAAVTTMFLLVSAVTGCSSTTAGTPASPGSPASSASVAAAGALSLSGAARCPQPGELTALLHVDPSAGNTGQTHPHSGPLTAEGCGVRVRIPGADNVTLELTARTPGTQTSLSANDVATSLTSLQADYAPNTPTQAAAPEYGSNATLISSQTATSTETAQHQHYENPYDDVVLAVVDGNGNWLFASVGESADGVTSEVWPAPSVPSAHDLLRTWVRLIYPGS